jgi:tetratricopeptide (TPR) repeat protein
LEKGDQYFGHGGQDIGFICQFIASVDGGYGAVVMTNSDGRSDVLIGEILRAIAQEYGWKGYVPEPVQVIMLPQDKLRLFEGRYLLDSDNVLTVKLEESELKGKETGLQFSFALLPVAPAEFIRRDRAVRYSFAGQGGLTIRSGSREQKVGRLAAGVSVPLECLLEGRYEEAATLYRKLRASNAKDPAVEESRLNGMGYQLMQRKMLDAALTLFKLNVEFNPESWNAYDSLAEGYMTKGENDQAIKNYEKSLQLNPKNVNGAKMLEKLKKKGEELREAA